MSPKDLITLCVMDAQDIPSPPPCVLWLFHEAPGCMRVFRLAVTPGGGAIASPAAWADILSAVVAHPPLWVRLPHSDPAAAACGLAPVVPIPPSPPSHMAILVPYPSGTLLEAAGQGGEAAEAPWIRAPENAAAAARPLPRTRSLAALLLDIARQAAAARSS